MLVLLLSSASGFQSLPGSAAAVSSRRCAAPPQLLNLFGNSDESKTRRDALSLRDAPAGSRKIQFRKPNQATKGLQLGLKFKESFGKAVTIDKIIPGTEAARLKANGQISEGDEITMVSATFGDEMWSARGIGKYRLEKSIAVRQGMTISFVFEGSSDKKKASMAAMKKQRSEEEKKMTRLQKQLQKEVDDDKKKGGLFDGLFK